MKASDVRTKTADQLNDELASLKKEQFNLRFQRASRSSAGTSRASRPSPPKKLRPRRHKDKNMPKRILQGTVVSDKNEKTVVVKVERRFTHPVMKKTVRSTKKYKAHDENNACKVGDQVFIQESKPISKDKRWVVITEAQAQ